MRTRHSKTRPYTLYLNNHPIAILWLTNREALALNKAHAMNKSGYSYIPGIAEDLSDARLMETAATTRY